MSDIITQARAYLSSHATPCGNDACIGDGAREVIEGLCAEVERLRGENAAPVALRWVSRTEEEPKKMMGAIIPWGTLTQPSPTVRNLRYFEAGENYIATWEELV